MTKWIKQAAKLPGWQSSTSAEQNANPKKIPEVDAYLAKAKKWREEQVELREILFGCGLTEELKWSKPCYTFEGHNVAIIQGFKEFCAVLFPNGALLKDPKGFLEKPGENSHSARRMPFRSLAEITKKRAALKAFVKEAVKAEKAGKEVEARKEREPIPEELQRKMKSDPELKKAFEALTPGRQRGYILHISAAKQSTTRENRIGKWRPHILDGKGMHDR
ncbi:MAG: YdeI/OmpD-associated family protein [Verrucomicrobiae bacterium]|nr:YdeI/OmpD-associated family protein [Verrucomicrobiae bacterium]